MEPRREYYDEMLHSPHHNTSGGQWSPPPQFQEHDQTYSTESSPQLSSSHPHSPSARSPSLQQHQHAPPQVYPEGYFVDPTSPAKTTPYATHANIDVPTPDYSAPEVVSGHHQNHFHDGRSFSPPLHGDGTPFPHGRPYTFKEHVGPYDSAPDPPPVPPKDDRKCGMKKRTFWILLGCLLAGLIALGVGLGVGLSLGLKKKSDGEVTDPLCRTNPKLCIGGALDSNYFSKKGAFNGSGIALAGESWSPEGGRYFTLYFQHHSGRIRYMQYTKKQQWIGGTEKEIVATDAKDATPISAVSYAINLTQYFHVFYVAKDNTVKQVTLTNLTTTWQPGPLSDLKLKVHDSPSVGLQACWKGNYYGDEDYKKFTKSSGEQNDTPYENQVGMNIWYAADNSTFQQYAWYNGSSSWQWIQKWQGFNTQAGVGCYSWGPGTTQYAMMVNKDEDVEFWWKDTNKNLTLTSPDTHPINSWQNGSKAAIPDVYPSTSLGFTEYFYAQSADRSIKGYNISYNAENTTFAAEETFVVKSPAQPVQALGGTHLTVTSITDKDAKGNVLFDSLYVFFQTVGNDITAATRRRLGGEWTIGSLVIPDD